MIATIHITKNNIMIVEGITNGETCTINHYVTIPDVDGFFDQDTAQIENLKGLVELIIKEMRTANINAKTLNICYDSQKFETEFDVESISYFKKQKQDIQLFKKKNGQNGQQEQKIDKKIYQPEIKQVSRWGKFITQSERGEMVTTTIAERDLINSFVSEFYAYGYKVNSIEPIETSIMYLRKFVPYTYDSMNKIVLYAENDNGGQAYIFTKDCPSLMKKFRFDDYEGDSIEEKISNIFQREVIAGKMRNPYVYVAGPAFTDDIDYNTLFENLAEKNIKLIDLYDNVDLDETEIEHEVTQVLVKDEGNDDVFDGRYAVCISLITRLIDKEKSNLCDKKDISIAPRSVIVFSKVFQVVAIIVLVISIGLAGWSGYKYYTVENELKGTENYNHELGPAESQRDIDNTKLAAINTIDDRYAKTLAFVQSHLSAKVNLISVDTNDLLPGSGTSTTTYGDETASVDTLVDAGVTDEETTDDAQTDIIDSVSTYQKQQIIIRGYTSTSDGASEVFDALVAENIGAVKLVGVEQMKLPSEELLYVFELTID